MRMVSLRFDIGLKTIASIVNAGILYYLVISLTVTANLFVVILAPVSKSTKSNCNLVLVKLPCSLICRISSRREFEDCCDQF